MITVSEGILKDKMAEYFRQVKETGEELIITDNDSPILKISPIKKKKHVKEVFADIQGRIRYYDDVLKPETEEWEGESG